MFIKLKSAVVLSAFLISALISAEEKKADAAPEISPKLIKLNVKRSCKTRKNKSKSRIDFPESEGGTDYQFDDKTDFVSLTVNIENKNKSSLKNFKILISVYGESVTDRRALPTVYTELVEPVKELKSRAKYKKEFKCEMVYDKSEDVYEVDKLDKNGEKIINAFNKEPEKIKSVTPAFGNSFYGYKLDIVNEDGKIIATSLWPSKLAKVIEKAKIAEKLEKQKNK